MKRKVKCMDNFDNKAVFEAIEQAIREDEHPELEGYTFTHEESFGGEGKGDHAHHIYKAEKEGNIKYVKMDGFYSSDYGTEWDSAAYFVTPFMKEVKAWKKV